MSKATEAIDASLENLGEHGQVVKVYENEKVTMPEIMVSIHSKEGQVKVASEICNALALIGLDNVGVKTRYDRFSRDYYSFAGLGKDVDIAVFLPPVVKVSSIVLNKKKLDLIVGASEALTTTVKPDEAENKKITWSVDLPAIATVTNGTVKAIKEGTAIVKAKSADGLIEDSCTVTIPKPAVKVASVALNKKTLSLEVGANETLTSTLTPPDATNKTVTWSVDKPEFATVTAGKVVAVKAGTAIVTITTADGSKVDKCTVTVTAPVEV